MPCTCWSARQSCTNFSITSPSLSSAPCRPRTSLSRSPSCRQSGSQAVRQRVSATNRACPTTSSHMRSSPMPAGSRRQAAGSRQQAAGSGQRPAASRQQAGRQAADPGVHLAELHGDVLEALLLPALLVQHDVGVLQAAQHAHLVTSLRGSGQRVARARRWRGGGPAGPVCNACPANRAPCKPSPPEPPRVHMCRPPML